MNSTTSKAAAEVIPGDQLVVRSAYGDKAHNITAVWGTDEVTLEMVNTIGNTFTRIYRPNTIIEIIATAGDR